MRVSVIKFSAAWCGPCRKCAPVFEKLREELGSQAHFYEIDVEKGTDATAAYKVMVLPTFVFLVDDWEVDRVEGSDMNAVTDVLKRLIAENNSVGTTPVLEDKETNVPQV